MIQRTLKQVRSELQAVAGTTGMNVSDSRFTDRLNLCQQELMDTGDYPGVVDRWLFKADQATGHVALPSFLDRLMSVTVDDVPRTIVSPWYEFYQYGPGQQDDYTAYGRARRCWIDVVMDRGETPVQVPIPDSNSGMDGPWVLRIYPAVDETVGAEIPVINVQGLDDDGLIIRSLTDGTAGDYYTGLNIPIDFAQGYVETTQQYSKITGVIKPATNGYVKITAWNGVDEVELSNYAYNETTPSYRRYYIPAIHNRGRSGVREKVLLGRCRKRFVPVSEDDDLLIISNINALKSMIIAQWKRDAGDYEAYGIQKQTAVDILKREAEGYHGKSRIPSITFQRGYPVGPSPCVR